MEHGERMIIPAAVVDYRHCTVILYVVLSVDSDEWMIKMWIWGLNVNWYIKNSGLSTLKCSIDFFSIFSFCLLNMKWLSVHLPTFLICFLVLFSVTMMTIFCCMCWFIFIVHICIIYCYYLLHYMKGLDILGHLSSQTVETFFL